MSVVAMIGAVAIADADATAAQTPPTGDPFAIEATALVPLDTESAVSIVGINGDLSISTRDERELRVVSRAPGPRGAEWPVGIWQDGPKLILGPAPGEKGGPRLLRVEVPKGFAIAVDAADSDVTVQSEGSGLDLRGANVRSTIQALGGSVFAELVGGTLNLRDSKNATVRAHGAAVTISDMSGSVTVHAVGGTIALTAIDGSTDLESVESQLLLDGLAGPVRLKAQKGEAKIAKIKAGAELVMVGTPLHLREGKGDITVTSDAPVEFLEMAASMHLDMYGGSLRGKGNQGILEVRTRNTEVNVESIADGMRIQGDGLTARIADIGGELYVETTISDVVVDGAESVVLRVDRGNVTIQRATGAVEATVIDGDVHILDGSGPVTLDMDRGDAEVSWVSLSGDKDSQLVNKSGSVTARFPRAGACRVEAKSRYGRIDSDLPTVKVMDDLTEAQGPVNRGNRPMIHITAAGDIHLLDASKIQEAN